MRARITLGVALLIIGAAFLLVRLDILEADTLRFLLPVVLILYALDLLVHRLRSRKEPDHEPK